MNFQFSHEIFLYLILLVNVYSWRVAPAKYPVLRYCHRNKKYCFTIFFLHYEYPPMQILWSFNFFDADIRVCRTKVCACYICSLFLIVNSSLILSCFQSFNLILLSRYFLGRSPGVCNQLFETEQVDIQKFFFDLSGK